MDARDFERAETLTRALQAADPALFTANNYDYLLARLAQRRGANAEAQGFYLKLVEQEIESCAIRFVASFTTRARVGRPRA